MLAAGALPAALGAGPERWVMRVDDPLAEIVDVPAVNEYFGWYYELALGKGTPLSMREARRVVLDNLERLRIELAVDKPLIISEFGAGAKLKPWPTWAVPAATSDRAAREERERCFMF